MLSRRHLIASAMGASAAWLGAYPVPLQTQAARIAPLSTHRALVMYCSSLNCPATIGKACLRTLPTMEATTECLSSLILSSLRSAQQDSATVLALSNLITEASRFDFQNGQITHVDGWTLSVTEARVYALALLCDPTTEICRTA